MAGIKPVFVQERDVVGSITDQVTTKTLYLTNIEIYQTKLFSCSTNYHRTYKKSK